MLSKFDKVNLSAKSQMFVQHSETTNVWSVAIIVVLFVIVTIRPSSKHAGPAPDTSTDRKRQPWYETVSRSSGPIFVGYKRTIIDESKLFIEPYPACIIMEVPLSQRTTGRRSRQRQRKQMLHSKQSTTELHDSNDGTTRVGEPPAAAAATASGDWPLSTKLPQQPQHRPRPEIESQIDAAIQARKKQQQQRKEVHHDPVPTDVDHAEQTTTLVGQYEYLDHTADVQLHSWGPSLEEALESLAMAMFGYMTDLALIQVDEEHSLTYGRDVASRGHDVQSLVFCFLQEWLGIFHETGFVPRQVKVSQLDRSTWSVVSSGQGERFDPARHAPGTEVKAVTYGSLQVQETNDQCHIWVIVDI